LSRIFTIFIVRRSPAFWGIKAFDANLIFLTAYFIPADDFQGKRMKGASD
jgi:hypothetical protein